MMKMFKEFVKEVTPMFPGATLCATVGVSGVTLLLAAWFIFYVRNQGLGWVNK